jgi:hypothetical protein
MKTQFAMAETTPWRTPAVATTFPLTVIWYAIIAVGLRRNRTICTLFWVEVETKMGGLLL